MGQQACGTKPQQFNAPNAAVCLAAIRLDPQIQIITFCLRCYNGFAVLVKPMIHKRKTDIIDDFISKVQSHASAMKKAQRIDDLEAVLRTLFASDDEQAIETSDKIHDVLERKRLTIEKRISMIETILRKGGIYL